LEAGFGLGWVVANIVADHCNSCRGGSADTRQGLTTHVTLHLFYEYFLVLTATLKTTDSTCTEIKVHQSSLQGSTITVWDKVPQISAAGKFEGCFKSDPHQFGRVW
jgi:hypothetical protein